MNKPPFSVRTIAFYLPQYHPIPENDKWWGDGFTEWTNVRKAEPCFPGHYQPHVPAQLGYYDLRDPAARRAQAELAREYGIHGFCYYHYWFNGKRLLETPFNEVLKSGEPDFPFCLCWANENWTRRWDGLDREVLMAQTYSDADSIAFIREIFPAFRDNRYIRVNGKALLLVYRTSLFPDPQRTAAIWREEMHLAGMGDLYLVRVENNVGGDESCPPHPAEMGFDAAMEFAPNWGAVGQRIGNLAEAGLSQCSLPENIAVLDYEQCMRAMMARPTPDYKLLRGVFPAWDNSSRRKTDPVVFINSSPEKYAYWLSLILRHTVENFAGDERLVFINAWNEWGEGCHLEPDEKFGLKYLEATRLALRQIEDYYQVIGSKTCRSRFDFAGWYNEVLALYGEASATMDADMAARLRVFSNLFCPLDSVGDAAAANALIKRKDEVIAALQGSLCWRLTAPIRKLLDRLS